MIEGPNYASSDEARRYLKRVEIKRSRAGEIASELGQTVFGQEKALNTVSQTLSMIEAGMTPKDKPLGAFFLLGPTGVGKTELARAIAQLWFGDPNSPRLRKINGGDFTQEHDDKKFIGSPNGYVGADEEAAIPHSWLHEGSAKTGKLKRSIVLVDEADKMHHNVINKIFLSPLENAELMARNGKHGFERLDFSNTLFIFTSNTASEEMAKAKTAPLGFSHSAVSDKKDALEKIAMTEMKKSFRPEFINRLTDIAMFNHLERDSGHYEHIFDKFIRETNERFQTRYADQSPYLQVTHDLRNKIINSIDITYGARDLKRAIDRNVTKKFSDIINSYYVQDRVFVAALDEEGEINFYADRLPRQKKRPAPKEIFVRNITPVEEAPVPAPENAS